ncbi:MAG: NAD(P)/FAD-dependent oxidoreductase, partial [Smithellaceae bacterium]|nr:NAD(P)/FAD-dependent oxidoreductase [Smithellaceae bacterium]
ESLIVLGGGAVGLEIAQAFARLGSEVTIVEFTERILGGEDEDLTDILRLRLETEGIKFLTSTKVTKAEKTPPGVRLHLAPASGAGDSRRIEVQALLVAAGRIPNTEGLALDKTGVSYGPRGIATDDRLRTNVPHIFACGDVNGKLPFTHVAGYEAGIALANAVLRLPRKADYDKIGWCTYTDPEIASIGWNEIRARNAGLTYRLWEEEFLVNDRAQAEGETSGKIKLLLSPQGSILGCQIVGARAGDLIHEWVLAVSAGVKLSAVAGTVHLYPNLSEISKTVAGNFFAEKIFSEKTKKILHYLLGLKGRACGV